MIMMPNRGCLSKSLLLRWNCQEIKFFDGVEDFDTMKLMYFQFSSHLLLFAWRLPPPTGKKDFFRRGYDDDDDDDNADGKNGDVEEEKKYCSASISSDKREEIWAKYRKVEIFEIKNIIYVRPSKRWRILCTMVKLKMSSTFRPQGLFFPAIFSFSAPTLLVSIVYSEHHNPAYIYILSNFLGVGGNGLLADSSCGVLGSRQKKSGRGFTFFQNSQNHYQGFTLFWNSQNHNYDFCLFKAHKIIYNFDNRSLSKRLKSQTPQ